MLRISSRLKPHVKVKFVRAGAQRLQSTYSGGGGGGNKALIGAAGVTSVVAGVVGYSAYSDDNRKVVEKTLPGSNYLLGAILGPLSEPGPPQPKAPPQEGSLIKKKLEREKKKKKQQEEAAAVAPTVESSKGAVEAGGPEQENKEIEGDKSESAAPVSESAVEGASAPEVTVITTEGRSESPAEVPSPPKEESVPSDLETRLASGEISEGVENAALTQALDDLSVAAQKEITAALSAAEDAAIVIRQHSEKAYQAIEGGQDKELLFSVVAELSNKRAELMKVAQEKISASKEAVEKFEDAIAGGQSSGLTKNNASLIPAEETLADLKYAVNNIKAIISEAERDSKVINDYRDLVESGREQFESEVRSLLPEVKLGETSDKLTTDELNLLIAHAHRKVLQLQKQLARQQTLEHDRFKEALAKQREEDSVLLETKILSELEKQQQQLEVEHKRKVAQLREELEGELRAQLKRQAAAHSDHLSDVLAVQEKELEGRWLTRLHDDVQAEKDKYLTSLAKVQGHLDGLKGAMAERADVDKAAYAARELWLACESLRSALRLGGDDAKSWEEQLKPLKEHVCAIIAAAGGPNQYIDSVLKSIDEEAVTRGVYTEEALRERFLKVERICKRVSMIGDNGGSLLRYLLSYVQSFLILNAFEYLPGTEVRDEEIPVDSLSTYDILARARYCLEKDDLTQSVRYMNLLRGEPRNVAGSWLKEARLTLETRQAADALLAHAAATAVKAL